LVAFLMLALGLAACSSPTPTPTVTPNPQGTLTIFHAGSLAVPFQHLNEEFNKLYPDVKVEMESAGSLTTIRKVTELGKQADVIGSADYAAIEQLMFPEYADWYVKFSINRMVIAYTDHSKYADEISEENWYEVLTRDGVEYGYSDPNADPCGYRTLMVFQLAEKHYGVPGLDGRLNERCPESNIRPKSVELVNLLESGDLDYAFEYLSVAVQHGLKYVALPVEIDLSAIDQADFYANAQVEIAGEEPGTTQTVVGEPIVYGVTIPKNAPRHDLAVLWVEFLLGPDGCAVLERDGQPAIVPALARNIGNLPQELRGLAQE
jgi:molybdate/tungstate transport system substrate-binding protein